ncbi:MAG: PLP-dependent lyase/thiolase [Armatimonadetes bacterium]|nr:PLP-dependent lyase/thiolase [Armatimonadota bacterium]
MPEIDPTTFENLFSRCLFCDEVREEPYQDGVRECPNPKCPSAELIPPAERPYYVSLVPDFSGSNVAKTARQEQFEVENGPAPRLNGNRPSFEHMPPTDGKYGVADLFSLEKVLSPERTLSRGEHFGWAFQYPYKQDLLSMKYGLRCGNSDLITGEDLYGFQADVLDLSGYAYSLSLKDLRSWAIINVALERGFKHLALWTAGNAGYSLARLAYVVNRRLPESERIQVYCIVEAGLEKSIRLELRRWQAEVVKDVRINSSSAPILSNKDVWTLIEKNTGKAIPERERWHVTDGWDGVGIMMYYLLALQVLKRESATSDTYDAVIVPVGSGDLFAGFLLALRDAYTEKAPKLIAAVPPAGENIFTTLRARRRSGGSTAAGKLQGTYSPLAKALLHLKDRNRFQVEEVDDINHRKGAQLVLNRKPYPLLPAEPSALLAFGALCQFGDSLQRSRSRFNSWSLDSRVLVVSSGCGVTPLGEQKWLEACWNDTI